MLICGDRNWTDVNAIDTILLYLQYRVAIDGTGPLVIIEGEARGADSIARERAEYHGITVEKYPANWNKYHKAAGPIRNEQMLKEGKPDFVIAFHDHLEDSKGTAHMVRLAEKAGIPVTRYKHDS